MSNKNIAQAVTRIVDELEDFSPEERRRIVRASLTLLGDSSSALHEESNEIGKESEFPAKARMWMKQYNLSDEQLSQVFHSGHEGIEIIAPIPGPTRREQVRNAYVLSGVAQLLTHGETKFDDKAARQVCEKGGFFDGSNHMKYMKGSEFTGSKEKGWVLTTPGLKHGAALIAEMTK